MPACHLRITGLVQGVFFRAEMLKTAERLGVTGWVRNTDDGAVEAHIEGADDALDTLIAWCRNGPPAARVDGVEIGDTREEGFANFTVTA